MTNSPVSLDDITHWAPAGSCARIRMLRLDAIHPVVSGNKWFKLGPNLKAARDAGFGKLLSFGGGYSNHLVALAFAAREQGLGSSGIVRGQYDELTSSLQACEAFGMELHFVSGHEYALLKDGFSAELAPRFPAHFIIPEGGSNTSGIAGASRIAELVPPEATDVCVAAGTGTTLAGLDVGMARAARLHGYCVAKDMDGAKSLIAASRFPERIHLHSVDDPRFGRWKPLLLQFIRNFFEKTSIRLDVVYTGKMMQELYLQLSAGNFTGKNVVCIHTGGLQGNPRHLFPDESL